jgi:L,D-transpeptidase ErfK/SrfK
MLGIALAFTVVLAAAARAETLQLPVNGDSVVGHMEVTSSVHEDTISDLAHAYDQGFLEMRLANPKVDAWLPGTDTEIIIPSQYVLPEGPKSGIVINVPEMRLYYYPKAKAGEPKVMVTYPISIGRQDWSTPQGLTKVVAKTVDPAWYPPASIREEHAANGDPLPERVPPGPDNPLGRFALRLAHDGYLIHGTNKPYGVGMRVTHGCLRLYPKDIERLFGIVPVGTEVRIVNQPFKLGWSNGALYLETHPSLEEQADQFQASYNQLAGRVSTFAQSAGVEIDWDLLEKVAAEKTGVPTIITKAAAEPSETTPTDLLQENDIDSVEISPSL